MEEDIRVLYDFIDGKESKEEAVISLENLIARNKDLEECLEVTSKALNNVAYDQIPIAIEDLKISSVPKSKVREKIKEYKKMFDMREEWYSKDYIIEILEELLQ